MRRLGEFRSKRLRSYFVISSGYPILKRGGRKAPSSLFRSCNLSVLYLMITILSFFTYLEGPKIRFTDLSWRSRHACTPQLRRLPYRVVRTVHPFRRTENKVQHRPDEDESYMAIVGTEPHIYSGVYNQMNHYTSAEAGASRVT